MLLFTFLSICIYINIISGISRRYKPQLTYFGHLKDQKRALFDHQILRKHHDKHSKTSLPVSLSITPSTLSTPGGVQDINVNWNNSESGSSNDWIGIYSPANASDDEYLDYFHSDGEQQGTYQVRVWNMRDSYQARYFTESVESDYVLQSISNIATVNAEQPLQGHISLTDKSPNEMQIRWVSALISNPMVKIGTKSGQYTSTISATYYTYDTSMMCGGTASIISPTQFRDPGYIYTAIADNLSPDTTYYYIFGNDEYQSDEHQFTTSSADNTKPFQFVMYGDQGTYTNAFPTIANIEKILDDIDLVQFVFPIHIFSIHFFCICTDVACIKCLGLTCWRYCLFMGYVHSFYIQNLSIIS